MEGTTRLSEFQDIKVSIYKDDSYFPLDIRSLILEHIRQSDGDFCDYNAAFSLILSLCQAFILYFVIFLHYPIFSNTNQEGENNIDQQYVPNPSIYAQVLETIETKYDSSFTSSAFIMLKQLQGILKQELKGKVWRPRSHGHWFI